MTWWGADPDLDDFDDEPSGDPVHLRPRAGIARRPVAHVTDTYFAVYDYDTFLLDREAWLAISEWCKRHGLDPADVASSGPIHRDVEGCRIVYVGRDQGFYGNRNVWTTCVKQGETPPLPWPAELDKYRMPQGAWT